jgi:hypothetical protein
MYIVRHNIPMGANVVLAPTPAAFDSFPKKATGDVLE